MTARQWLGRGDSARKKIAALRETKEKLYAEVTGTTPGYAGDVVMHKGESRKMEKYAEVSEALDAEEARLLEICRETVEVIRQVEDQRYYRLLLFRYVEGRSWTEVAERMGYTFVHVTRNLHPAALGEVDKLLKKS